MTHSESISKIAAALVKAQGGMPAVGKEGNNPAFRSRYMTLDGILAVAVPVLTKHGIAVVQGSQVESLDESQRPVAVCIETRLLHESGEWLAVEAIIPVSKQDAHGMGSAITYGRRYSLASILGIMADEDDDANNAVSAAPKQAMPSQPRRQGFVITEPVGGRNGNR